MVGHDGGRDLELEDRVVVDFEVEAAHEHGRAARREHEAVDLGEAGDVLRIHVRLQHALVEALSVPAAVARGNVLAPAVQLVHDVEGSVGQGKARDTHEHENPHSTWLPRGMEEIVGRARHVMRVLGKGHREQIYAKALQMSLQEAGIPFRSEVACPIMFMGKIVGHGFADLVVGEFVVEIKANRSPIGSASDQLNKYLQSLRKIEKQTYVGIILNFNQKSGRLDVAQQRLRIVSRFFGRN